MNGKEFPLLLAVNLSCGLFVLYDFQTSVVVRRTPVEQYQGLRYSRSVAVPVDGHSSFSRSKIIVILFNKLVMYFQDIETGEMRIERQMLLPESFDLFFERGSESSYFAVFKQEELHFVDVLSMKNVRKTILLSRPTEILSQRFQ